MLGGTAQPSVKGARVVVVGAGIGGLTAAFRLRQAGCDVMVLERCAPERVGGRMAGVRRCGWDIDLGAPLLARRYHRMLTLAREAGLAGEILDAADVMGVVRDGRVHRGRTGTPGRLLSGCLTRHLPVRDRARLTRDLLRFGPAIHPANMSRMAAYDDESLTRYVQRRRLAPPTLDTFLDPLNCTLTLAEPEDSAAAGAFVFLSFLLFGQGLFTFRSGSGALPRALARSVAVTHHAEVTSVESTPSGVTITWTLPGRPERTTETDAVVLAVPTDRLPHLYPQLPSDLKELFGRTAYARLIQTAFCLPGSTGERSVLLAAPRTESPHVTSFVLQHNLHPQRLCADRGLATAYLRGRASAQLWDADDTKITGVVLAAADRLGVLPELARDTRAVYIDRLAPCVVTRSPGEYRAIAAATPRTFVDTRIQLAGGELYGHSTTIGSLTSGEHAAQGVLSALRASTRTA
ncbi:protoporphyrinogen/coproporphyrinogen oxidase [Streptomyces lavendulae]|uniref:protoporphyrinogen/coproporphyrinogen oxidase n=1 Tax=Streptomyces lavendulae TaxID=1914 RepID=UPI0024A145AC|nr:FAD-dependent oxidoreductase [Streptomyces lavendulae]GLW04519.1 hypothetical protein Slala05_81490 [Streptomyces lavendulae subsp. lavendulae]